MKYIFLSEQFYKDYDRNKFPEIEHKHNRPYVMLLIQIEELKVAIPFRSHISHNNAFFTDIQNRCGIDYTKTVILNKDSYIIDSFNNNPIRLRENEYRALFGKKHKIIKGVIKYIKEYKRAVKNKAQFKSNSFKYSTLQYFHKELGI